MRTIVKMIFGSHLYGTDTPESDKDYKGVFIPDINDVLMGKIPKQITENTKKGNEEKNTPEDVDCEMYSIHKFINLLCQGETVAIDMVHAPDHMILESTWEWDWIVKNRKKAYSRNMKAFVGYARKQAAKYGIKGSRLAAVKKVLDYLDTLMGAHVPVAFPDGYMVTVIGDFVKLKEVWDELPEGEHVRRWVRPEDGSEFYEVCGKKFQDTCRVEHVYHVLRDFEETYGHRARQAMLNKDIDWKAMSHALRAAYQVRDILLHQDLFFPLAQAPYLREVKQGKRDFKEVQMMLESIMADIDLLAENSTLPDMVDRKFWDKVLLGMMSNAMLRYLAPWNYDSKSS